MAQEPPHHFDPVRGRSFFCCLFLCTISGWGVRVTLSVSIHLLHAALRLHLCLSVLALVRRVPQRAHQVRRHYRLTPRAASEACGVAWGLTSADLEGHQLFAEVGRGFVLAHRALPSVTIFFFLDSSILGFYAVLN